MMAMSQRLDMLGSLHSPRCGKQVCWSTSIVLLLCNYFWNWQPDKPICSYNLLQLGNVFLEHCWLECCCRNGECYLTNGRWRSPVVHTRLAEQPGRWSCLLVIYLTRTLKLDLSKSQLKWLFTGGIGQSRIRCRTNMARWWWNSCKHYWSWRKYVAHQYGRWACFNTWSTCGACKLLY